MLKSCAALLFLLLVSPAHAGITRTGPTICSEVEGCFGMDVSALSGYPKNTGGVFAFSTTIPFTDLSGSIGCAQMPALTGPITSTAGTCVTAINAQTGTGSTFVMSVSPIIATPTFTTSATGPILYGGAGAGSTLTLKGTSHGSPSGAWVTVTAPLQFDSTVDNQDFLANQGHAFVYSSQNTGSGVYPFNVNGNLILQARTSLAYDVILAAGTTTPSVQFVAYGAGGAGVGSPTSAGLGVGKLNVAGGYYINGTALASTNLSDTANLARLDAANVFSSTTGQSVKKLLLPGSTSGTLTVLAAATAGTTTLTLPGGTTDFSATGGTSQVVKQTSPGGAFTVAQLAFSDLSSSLACAQLPALTGNVTTSAGSCVTTIAASVVTNAMLAGSIAASKLIGTDIATVGTLTAGTASTGFVLSGVTVTVGSDATGDLHYRNSSGVFTRLAVGTSSQVLIGGTNPTWGGVPGAAITFANPTASVGLSAINGSATTPMRSDGAPALSQAIAPTWSALHTFSQASGSEVVRMQSTGIVGFYGFLPDDNGLNITGNNNKAIRIGNGGGFYSTVGGNENLALTPGAIGMAKMGASTTAPGAAGCKIELICSATAGKGKLVMACGTSGTTTTVVDAVGSGLTGC